MFDYFEDSKHRKVIILLIFTLLFIIATTYILSSKQKDTSNNSDSISSIPLNITPKPNLPLSRFEEFKYPLKFENISVEYRPKSGTFIIYYQGLKGPAEDSFRKFMRKKALLFRDYNTDYRSIDLISPMPREFFE